MTQAVKKRLSKKSKGSWRKIEHADVEEFLEDQRLEDRAGKVSEKTNDELFAIDTLPAKRKVKKIGLTKLEKRQKLREKPMKCFASLENDSKVTDPIVKRNRVRTREERQHPVGKKIQAEKEAKGIFKKTLLQSVEDRQKTLQQQAERDKKHKKREFVKDIWEFGSLRDQRKDFKDEWIDRKVTDYHLVNTGTPVNKAHASAYHKRSKLKVIEIPHPGTSYNPSFEAHQELLEQVKEREEKIIKREAHLNRVTTEMFNKVSVADRDSELLQEQRSGMDDDDEKPEIMDEELSDDEDANEFIAINPPVEVKPKDRKARRKQKELKERQKLLEQKKLEKKKITDITLVKSLKKEIRSNEMKLQKKRELKRSREEEHKQQPHRLSKFEYEEDEILVNMPEDIPDSLRNVKPEGSLLKDRFKSLQKRNILPTSKDLGLRRRRDIKRYVRNTHKVELEQIQKKKKK